MAASANAGAKAKAAGAKLPNSGPGATAAGHGTEPQAKRQRMQQRGAADGGPLAPARQPHQPPSAGPLPRGKGVPVPWSHTSPMQRCEQPFLRHSLMTWNPAGCPCCQTRCTAYSALSCSCCKLTALVWGMVLRILAGGCMCMHIHQRRLYVWTETQFLSGAHGLQKAVLL